MVDLDDLILGCEWVSASQSLDAQADANFKAMLDEADQLDNWYAYEQAAFEEGLTPWCVDNGFVASKKGSSPN